MRKKPNILIYFKKWWNSL